MPASYQGVILRSAGEPILDLVPPKDMTPGMRRLLDMLRDYNTDHQVNRQEYPSSPPACPASSWRTRCSSTHGGRRHRQRAGGDEARCTAWTTSDLEEFGRRCLLARRLVSRVRFVQLYAGPPTTTTTGTARRPPKEPQLPRRPHRQADRRSAQGPEAARLLDETLVIWGGEFGRQPTAEYAEGTGRDHNAYGFTMWMAGGGIKGGLSVGETDELGSAAVTDFTSRTCTPPSSTSSASTRTG